ncbi:hypothetical protein H2200_008095 [Cladophialophora chaetospira]|uniref:Uncharacterized protein n=1 Tax=Cladophialophora chaetospira TaxID=386627 RepID=A0AA38X546_9EURO|nr:hypothetical protein H2200_008095 [Cladophialophora chaetospira]
MLQDLADEKQLRLCEDRSASFRGTGRVELNLLDFKTPRNNLPSKNVVRLRQIFRNEGCLPLEPENRIVAIVSPEKLNEVLRASAVIDAQLLDNPNGVPPVLTIPANDPLRCLDGRSRVEAAKDVLLPGKRYWAVDFYLRGGCSRSNLLVGANFGIKDTSTELEHVLAEQYTNQREYSDLEVYYHIQQNHSTGDVFAEGRWRARLSVSKQRNLKQFLKHHMLSAALNEVLTIPGQRFGLTLSMCHEIITMKCPEEFIHYFQHIVSIWSDILDRDEKLMETTDRFTVETLQLRVPGRCKADYEAVKPLMDNGSLFEFVYDPQKRHRIWQNILRVPTLIPSLYGLAEDRKFLSPLAKILKKLFMVAPDQTLRGALMSHFKESKRTEALPVQASETSIQYYGSNPTQQLHWGIVQLFLFAGRDFPSLVPETPLKEHDRPKPVSRQPDMHVWASLARLARKLGFETDEIGRLMASDPDEDAAAMFLLQARPRPAYHYDERQFQQHKRIIRRMLNTAHRATGSPSVPTFFVERGGEGLERRCGRHWEQAYQYDRGHTFLPLLWEDNHDQGYGLSSLFVRVAVYKAFFGNLVSNDTNPPPTINHPFPPQPDKDWEILSDMSPGPPENHNGEDTEHLESLRSEVSKLKLEADQLRQVIQEEREVATEAKNAVETHAQDLSTANRQLQDCQSTHRSLLAQKEDLSRQFLEREGEISRLNAENADLKEKLNTMTQMKAGDLELHSPKPRGGIGNKTAEEMQSRLNEAEEEIASLRCQLEKASEDVEMHDLERKEQESQLDEHRTRLVEAIANHLHSLEVDIVQVQHELAQVNGVSSGQLIPTSVPSQEANSGTSHLQIARVADGMSTTSSADLSVSALNQKFQEASELDAKALQAWDDLKPGIRSICASLDAARRDADSAKQAYRLEVQNSNKERDRIRTENKKLTREIQKAHSEKEQIRKEQDELKSQAEIQSQKARERETERETELALVRHGGQELQQENTSLRAQLKALNSEPSSKALQRRDNRVRKPADKSGESTRRKIELNLPRISAQSTQQLQIEPVPPVSEQLSVVDERKARIWFQYGAEPEPFTEVTLNQQRLKRILERCKKNQLVLCDSKHKAMMPEDAWDIITGDGSLTVVLHFPEGGDRGKMLTSMGKRKSASHDRGQNRLTLDLDLVSGSHEAAAILQDILDGDELMEL